LDYRNYLAEITLAGDEVLVDWRWLIGPELQLWHVTKGGDALLRSPADGSIHFLDTMAGAVHLIADDGAAFETAVAVQTNATDWLMPAVVDYQLSDGKRPGVNECLTNQHPPVLGGQLDPDNIETCSVLVHFSIAGQIHRQIKDLPPGTKIDKIELAGETPKRPWWKFW
jgi:hypothetical protein